MRPNSKFVGGVSPHGIDSKCTTTMRLLVIYGIRIHYLFSHDTPVRSSTSQNQTPTQSLECAGGYQSIGKQHRNHSTNHDSVFDNLLLDDITSSMMNNGAPMVT